MALSIILFKMSDNIFALVYSDYDLEEHYFFSGPDESTAEDFENLCNQLMPQAGYRAVFQKIDPKNAGWICWNDVVETLVSLLEEHGYQRVSIDSFRVEGGSIIGFNRGQEDSVGDRLGFSGPLIIAYNYKIQKKLAEERKAKRNLRIGASKKKTIQIIK